LDPELLWLWRRLAATALIRPLAWEPPYAAGAAQEMAKKTKKKKKKRERERETLVQPLWKIVWSFLRKLNLELPHDPAIPLLGYI